MEKLQFKNWIIAENNLESKEHLNNIKSTLGVKGFDDAKVLNMRLGDIQMPKRVVRNNIETNTSWKDAIQGLEAFRSIPQNDPRKTAILGLNSGNTIQDLVNAFSGKA